MIQSDEISSWLGQHLLKQGTITQDQLRTALQEHRRTGELLGRTLKNLGFVKDDQLSRAYATQLEIPHVDLEHERVESEALSKVRRDFAKEKGLVPLRIDEGELLVAMADPYDVAAVDAIERSTGFPVAVVVAPEDQIIRTIARMFAGEDFSDASFENLIKGRRGEVEATPGRPGMPGRPSASLVSLVDQIIMKGVHDRATDIHIEPDEKLLRIRYRIDGILHQGMALPKELQNEVVSRVKIMSSLDIAEKRLPQDGQVTVKRGTQPIDIRVSIVPIVWGEAVVLRLLDKSNAPPALEQLGMSLPQLEALRKLANASHGIVLLTGPTGSGKTTTLYAAIQQIDLLKRSVLTLEDPIEYRIPLVRQTQVRPDIGFGFAEGFRSFLRQDPNVIMVGEMRDKVTMEIAVRAALTGHLVLSTLHTNSALEAIPRLVDMEIDPYLIGSSVIGLAAQRLVRRICTRCSRLETPRDDEREFLGEQGKNPKLLVARGEGCAECLGTGYRGREGIFEIFPLDDELRELIRKRVDHLVLLDAARQRGWTFLRDEGELKVLAGITTVDEVRRVIS